LNPISSTLALVAHGCKRASLKIAAAAFSAICCCCSALSRQAQQFQRKFVQVPRCEGCLITILKNKNMKVNALRDTVQHFYVPVKAKHFTIK